MIKKEQKVRARMAPSPTGLFHIGSVRTALFNYLFAKHHKGAFILRIEDTDAERSKQEFEKNIIESLSWLWIQADEDPFVGGAFGPYRQSERKDIYKKYLEKLFLENKAYYCFCPEDELENHRNYQLSIGHAPRYSGKCANLSEKEVKDNLRAKKPFVLRLRVPEKKIKFTDEIRGEIEFDTSLIGDIVIAKDFTNPLYNFACVIDDYEMQISHVIRGEEHISNTPKQIIIYEALGLPLPKYAHLPLILAPDKSKLSKRHGTTSVTEYREKGYLPEAIVNFIAFLGWNPDTEREIYSLPALVKEFSLDKVQKSGAVFNMQRLDFLNGFYIRQKSLPKLTELCIPYLVKAGFIESINDVLKRYVVVDTKEEIGFANIEKIVLVYQERLKKLSEIVDLTDFFFKGKIEYDKDLLKWKDMEDKDLKVCLDSLIDFMEKIDEEDFVKDRLSDALLDFAEKFANKIGKKGKGYVLWPLRVALTGKKESAGPFEIAEVLGKEKVLQRLKQAKLLL